MGLRWHTLVVECRDAAMLAAWWAETLNWKHVPTTGQDIVIAPPDVVDHLDSLVPDERSPGLIFVQSPNTKRTKNRLHLDLAPCRGTTQRREVERLLGQGAHKVDVGQGDVPWQVLADPEGNEFCVLPDGTP